MSRLDIKFTRLTPFKRCVLQNFPFIEEDFDALTNYGLLCKIVEYLNNVINSQNEVQGVTEEIVTAFNNLYDYVNNFFDNLDVQEEINNKLDEMAEAGTLQEIITSYVQSNVTWTFETVSDMQSATNLIEGSVAKTLGYYSVGDGGGAEYIITSIQPSGIYEEITGGLYASLNPKDKTIYTKQVGAVGDGITDDTTNLQKLFTAVNNYYKNNTTIIVNGVHFCQPNTLSLIGESTDNRLTNVSILGKEGCCGYGDFSGIEYGFIFDTTNAMSISDFNNINGIQFRYIHSLVIKWLKITTNENVPSGGIPLNGIVGIFTRDSRHVIIQDCNILRFYKGLRIKSGGYIKHNNISICNIGLHLDDTGDSIIEDNYINTIGNGIYNTITGLLDSRYSSLYSANQVWAQGIYVGGSGNHTIKGGKIEWCAIGIWQDHATNMIYTGIQFDRCCVCGIVVTSGDTYITRPTISNNNFTGCGGITLPSANSDRHIGGLSGNCVAISKCNGILVNGNKFYGDNGTLKGSFNSGTYYYGPVTAIKILQSRECVITGNIVEIDSSYAFSFTNSEIMMDGNIFNKDYYAGNNVLVYRESGKGKEYYAVNPNTLTIGSFDNGSIIHNINDLSSGWKVTANGTLTSINKSVSVVTVGTDYYPGDGSVIDMGTTYPDGVSSGCYVQIAGVTGVKKIVGVIKINNHYYAKLDSTCDVAVLNATMTNKTPTFTSI